MLQRATQILLDAARMGGLMYEAKERNKTHESLYRGTSSETLAPVAPYLFPFGWNSPFANWIMHEGWGSSWGVLLKSSYPLPELHKHFRKFLKVQTESGQNLYFRFYDPRVLRIFLPTCDAAQIREFFGGAIDYFMVEDEDPAYALRFSHQNGVLQTERFPVQGIVDDLPESKPLPPAPQEALPPETIAAIREMPPETIAALKEAGIILPDNDDSGTTTANKITTPAHGAPAKPAPKLEKAPPTPPTTPPSVATTPPTPAAPSTPDVQKDSPAQAPKPKTKWNTFE